MRAGCQVLPPSNDTDTAARVMATCFTSCRCPTETCTTCRPGGTEPFGAMPATWYRNVIIGSTAQARRPRVPGRHDQPAGRCAPGWGADRQVHTVLVLVDSGRAA